jgi:hypothetical protein
MNNERDQKIHPLVKAGRIVGAIALGIQSIGCARSASAPTVDPDVSARVTEILADRATATPDFQSTIDSLNAQFATQTGMPTATERVVTATPKATATVAETAAPEKTATAENVEVADWAVEVFAGATDQMKGWVKEFKNLNPVIWPNFPNVDNPQANFVAANGLEYGMDESVFCQQDETCDIPVEAGHYKIITADYDIAGIDACKGTVANQGCGIMIINVGNVTANFRDSKVDAGFEVDGRYWNGDKLPEAINGGLSHVANNMLNLDSKLNPDGSVNAGANCSVREGCKSVRLTFAIISGNELLVKGVTIVNR